MEEVQKKLPLRGPNGRFIPSKQEGERKAAIIKPKKDLRDVLKEQVDNQGFANYALSFSKSNTRFHVGDICHARMVWRDERDVAKNQLTAIAMSLHQSLSRMKDSNVEGFYKDYIDYILFRSPWKSCFLPTNIDEALDRGVLFDVSKNVSQLVGGAIALREGHEFSSKLHTFNEVRNLGYSDDVSYLVSFFIEKESYINTTSSSHKVLTPEMRMEDVIRFFKEGYKEGMPSMCTDSTQTSYAVWQGVISGNLKDKYAMLSRGGDFTLSSFVELNTVKKVTGKGFYQRTEFKRDKSVVMLADAFKEELEK